MKMIKKWLSCFLIITFLITFFHTNTYGEEVAASSLDKKVAQAVDKLMSFGIVSGKEDGEYHPEADLTREEFTKIMVEVLGMGSGAAIAPKETKFTDVAPEGWSAGYISLAVERGIIKGYDDNLFKPTEKVNLAQAVTIILRGLGYKEEFVSGSWPDNYIVKAVQTGLLDGIDISKDSIVNRGMAAVMIDRAMDIKLIKNRLGSDDYYVSDVTLLDEREDIVRLKNVMTIKKEKSKYKSEVVVEFPKDMSYRGDKYEKGERESFVIREDFDFELYESFSAEIYLDEDDRVFYLNYIDLEDEMDDFYGNQRIINGYDEKPFGEIKLSNHDEFIDVKKDSEIYVDGEKIEADDFNDFLNEDAFGAFVVENEEISYANLITWSEKDYYFKNYYLESNDIRKMMLECINTQDGTGEKIQLERYGDGYEVYLIEGNKKRKVTAGHLKKGDIVNISEKQENGQVLIYAWRNSISGKFNKLTGGAYGEELCFYTKDSQDKQYLADSFSYTYNGGKKVTSQKHNTVASNALIEFYNEEITGHRNWEDKVVFLEGNFNAKLDLYGILVHYGDALKGQIQIYTKDNKRVNYVFEELEEYERLKEYTPQTGIILKYSLSKSNKIKDLSDDISDSVIKLDNIKKIREGDDFGKDYAIVDGERLKVDSDTIFFDYTSKSRTSVKKMTWDKLKEKEVLEDVDVIIAKDNRLLKLLVIWDNIEGIKDDTNFGYVKSSYRLGDKYYVEIMSSKSDTESKHEISEDYRKTYMNNRLMMYGLTSDNKFKPIEDKDYRFIAGEIEDVSGDVLIVEGEEYRMFEEDTTFFNEEKKIRLNNLDSGDLVAMYVEDNDIVAAGVVLESDKKKKLEKGILKDVRPSKENCFIIEIDGEEKEFSSAKDIGYILKNGYLELTDADDKPIDILSDTIGANTPEVKFFYDKDTEEILDMWIDMNR